MRNSFFLFLFFAAFLAGCSGTDNEKTKTPDKKETSEEKDTKSGAPDEKDARDIVQNWFKHQNPGGKYFEPKEFNIISVTGDEKRAVINFKWTGLSYPPSLPNSNNSPFTVTDKSEKMQIQKNNGKWEVLVVEDN